MIILLHSSKTMRPPSSGTRPTGTPVLVDRAAELVERLRALTPAQLSRVMAVSADLAAKTRDQYAAWTPEPGTPAAETFVGDIYSGLRVDAFGPAERRYADDHIRILSGLYGILRPFDGIQPYRLEMGYRLPGLNLYQFWGASIAEQLPTEGPIVNLAAVEYSRTVTRHVAAERVVAPKFLTVDPKSGQPKFVVVHAKIARGAFARWLVTERARDLTAFAEIGYVYDEALSSEREPVFVCAEFGGKGLSVRLT
ncbi:YaaA family protein [Plantactinospora sp. GCM10030261]|uniref:YaaA family protein n=1 Tax=Plantactinospora sp. GCM10030261 TaxID=3273420 RepID=UPI0036072ECC